MLAGLRPGISFNASKITPIMPLPANADVEARFAVTAWAIVFATPKPRAATPTPSVTLPMFALVKNAATLLALPEKPLSFICLPIFARVSMFLEAWTMLGFLLIVFS